MSSLESFPDSATNNVNATVHMAAIYYTFSLAQLIQEPTRVTFNPATLIDHIATSHPEDIPESGVLKIALTDHYAVNCIRKIYGPFSASNYHHKNEKL